ncbi:3-oxoacyl-[acyl-carrier-protein] reductase [Lactobacillus sp. LC28-10]|uniref:3-oxoacyl-[acyl-carrier-protein] reductase n=1 Tax=Secundilactobacillus angelensis TaxID=2722706 RepID=A0ABX1L4J3_9LACO|nr:3-oxoacyl-[acyl-carrier-protein] reductase [Secundilactobacillus angelensis]MCH5463281.1 3-oxoacyl-[acyl-carrier-protein] reductase [Secundilactobacillus angelensis]NLR19236.1 3-oxoacyl-[acyl-carrier-protein] reductase [Secundilactobacillus angelensis]
MNLTNKTVLVTGSTQGIGLAIAQAFAKQGANIVLNGRHTASPEVVDSIRAEKVTCWDLSADVTDPDSVQAMIDRIYEKIDHLDIVVNNAGIVNDKLLNRMTAADFSRVINTNLTGTFNVIKACLRPMYKARSGAFINMASVIGLTGNIGQANYAASKAGIIGLTKSVAKEAAMRGIRCNAIAPGMIDTAMTAQLSEKVKGEILEQIPLKRLGSTNEVAQAAIFLAENDYVTGQTITVDGGLTMQ